MQSSPRTALLAGVGVMTLAAIAIVGAYHPWLIENDGAQYISIARNLLAGRGNASSTLMYESQFLSGRIPSPQTVWPPGFPAAIAGLMWAGVEASWAGFVLNFAAWLSIAALLYRLMLRAGTPATRAVLGSLAWSLASINVAHVLGSYSDMTFTALTVGAACCWLNSARRGAMTAAAAVGFALLASLAVLIRYAGLFFLAAAALHAALSYWMTRDARIAASRAASLLLPALCVAGLFTSVYVTIGSLDRSGDPLISRSIAAALKSLYWGFRDIFGMTVNFTPHEPPLRWIAGMGLILGLGAALVLRFPRGRVSVPAEAPARELLAFSTSIVFCTVGGLFSQALWTDAFLPRFLLPMLPFLCAALFQRSGLFDFSARHRWRGFAIASCTIGFVCGQAQAYRQLVADVSARQPRTDIEAALQTPVDHETLRVRIARGGAIIANQSQRLNLALDRPTIGLPTGSFSRRVWSESEIRRVAGCYRATSIVIFRRSYQQDVDAEQETRIPLFDALLLGEIPPWVRVITVTPEVAAYEVLPPARPARLVVTPVGGQACR